MKANAMRMVMALVLLWGAGGCGGDGTSTSTTGGDGGDAGNAPTGGGGQGGGPACSVDGDCDDDDNCTTDSCDMGSCRNVALDCGDGAFCNGVEVCYTDLGCQAGPPVELDDGVDCTDDACDEQNDVVVNTAVNANCDDSVGCTDDVCDAVNDCQFTANNTNCDDSVACTDDACDPVNDCQFTANNALCDDGVGCTDDGCDPINGCQFPVNDLNCVDGVGCTEEACDQINDCVIVPNHTLCDDGVPCTDDVCDLTNDCQGVANNANCNDGVACTDDVCDLVNDCQVTANNANCDDGVTCTDDVCDIANDCQLTANNANCDDGVGCTDDVCDLVNDCQFAANDALCPDPAGCQVGVCDPVADCLDVPDDAQCDDADTCTTDTCDAVDDCRNIASTAACGDLFITEIMQNPAVVADNVGEWFEITNIGAYDFNLAGCTIEDDGTDSHTIVGDLIMDQGERLALARTANPGGFVPDYVYGDDDLGNGLDEIVITCGGQEMARVNWDDGVLFPDPSGASMTLYENAQSFGHPLWGRDWCQATTAYNGADLGTPGLPNDPCPTTFIMDLTQGQEVPPTGTTELGSCVVTLNAAQTQLSVSCTHNVASPIAAHIHQAGVGVNGGVVFDLGNGTSPITPPAIGLTSQNVFDLLVAEFYINVHSAAFPGGAIRGQIVRAQILTHYLTGAEEVPPIATTAIGVCAHALPFGQSFLDAWCTHSAFMPSAAHIHNAPFGVNGGVLVGFSSAVTAINQRIPTDTTFLNLLFAESLYVNVHTAANPGGEIRGQIPAF